MPTCRLSSSTRICNRTISHKNRRRDRSGLSAFFMLFLMGCSSVVILCACPTTQWTISAVCSPLHTHFTAGAVRKELLPSETVTTVMPPVRQCLYCDISPLAVRSIISGSLVCRGGCSASQRNGTSKSCVAFPLVPMEAGIAVGVLSCHKRWRIALWIVEGEEFMPRTTLRTVAAVMGCRQKKSLEIQRFQGSTIVLSWCGA